VTPDPDRFAALLCDWCLQLQPGDQVLLFTTTLAADLVRAVYAAVLQRDAWPLLRVTPPELGADFYRYASARHLDGYPAADMEEMRAATAFLRIDAPADTRALANIDPALIARAARARQPIHEVRMARRWCGTLWPTPALAQHAQMGFDEYASFVARALFIDRDDPIAAWQELSARQAVLVDRLGDAREIRIEADGTDIRLRVDGRTWINSDGRRNMPSGEVFTGPLEDSAVGTIRFNVPTSPRGVEVTGVSLTFARGEVVDFRADRGLEYLSAALQTDAGARYLGELGIGTNPGIDRATGHILFDEKMAGTVHLALGRSYPETGGVNASALHWDLICDLRGGGRITADGQDLHELAGASRR
jgi:aminopeptidase